MKVLAISDNHGDIYAMEEIYSIYEGEIDRWIHCGDSELTEEHPHWQYYKTVRGNMDFTDAFPISRVEEYYGERFLVVHGHKHQVKMSFAPLKKEAQEEKARIAFYGHTHIPQVDKEDGIYFINPGSIAQPRGPIRKGSYAIVEINGDEGKVTYYDEDHNELKELSQSLTFDK
jgi:hypothetical protein